MTSSSRSIKSIAIFLVLIVRDLVHGVARVTEGPLESVMTEMLRILLFHSAEVAEEGVSQAVRGDAGHKVAPVGPLNQETAFRTLLNTLDGHLWLHLRFFFLGSLILPELSTRHPRVRGFRVAAGAHLDIADEAVEPFGFGVNKLRIVASRAVFQHLITVLHGRHLLELEADDSLVLII